MPVLDLEIPEKDWVDEVAERNGASFPPVKRFAGKEFEAGAPWEPAVQKIVEFQHLGDDWDGFGAKAPSREARAIVEQEHRASQPAPPVQAAA